MVYKNYTKVKVNNIDEAKKNSLNFIEDWTNIRKRHSGQLDILDSFFNKKCKKIFVRAGRKFAKTSTMIDIIWRFAIENPKSVIYYGFPTITQGIEVVWEEKRLQNCDSKEEEMNLKYVKKVDDNKHIVTFNNGSYVKLIGTWTESRGRGTQPNLLIMDEIQDCSPAYLDAMWGNMGAKDAFCLMAGTPPRIRNHYHEWEARFQTADDGYCVRYSSYTNTALDHLEKWLDNTHRELVALGRQDEWLREYMAEDCFVSNHRMLPDPKISDFDLIMASIFTQERYQPVVAMFSHFSYFVIIYALLHTVTRQVIILHCDVKKQLYDLSHEKISQEITEKSKEFFSTTVSFSNRIRKLIFDPSKTLRENIGGVTEAREDLKWQDRGIPLMREMMLTEKLIFTDRVGEIGVECQRLLMNEKDSDLIMNYPLVCSVGMLVNEFFTKERSEIKDPNELDIYQPLRDAGFYVPKKKKGKRIFSYGIDD